MPKYYVEVERKYDGKVINIEGVLVKAVSKKKAKALAEFLVSKLYPHATIKVKTIKLITLEDSWLLEENPSKRDTYEN